MVLIKKLNDKLPKGRLSAAASANLALLLMIAARYSIFASYHPDYQASCQAIGHIQPDALPRHSPGQSLNQSKSLRTDTVGQSESAWPIRDVTNLRMKSEFRAVKLHWTYDQPTRPAEFNIRYCELTFWDRAFRCVARDLRVSSASPGDPASKRKKPHTVQTDDLGLDQLQTNLVDRRDQPPSTVTDELASDTAGSLDDNLVYMHGDTEYETTISNLRAFTNYSFEVQVARFQDENHRSVVLNGAQSSNPVARSGKQLLPRRIETKPFGAEAVRCLANSSEVRVFTGRHFEGRISVEDSDDPRCEVFGNKTSQQEVYLFRIDHRICRSRIVDNAVRTTILVQENKDLITHTSARYPVICDFSHEPMVVKASLALPKVNSLTVNHLEGQSASKWSPGFATKLVKTPTGQLEQVRIGSIPGYFRPSSSSSSQRARNLDLASNRHGSEASTSNSSSSESHITSSTTVSRTLNFARPTDLDSSVERPDKHLRALAVTMDASEPVASLRAEHYSQRPSSMSPVDQKLQQRIEFKMHEPLGELHMPLEHPPDRSSDSSVSMRQARLAFDGPTGRDNGPLSQLGSPAPGSVGSEVHIGPGQGRSRPLWMSNMGMHSFKDANFATYVKPGQPEGFEGSRKSDAAQGQTGEPSDMRPHDLASPLTLTNNHRVSGHFLPLSQLQARLNQQRNLTNPTDGSQPSDDTRLSSNFSIRYSADQVSEYPLAELAPDERYASSSSNSGLRTGRMFKGDHFSGSNADQLFKNRLGDLSAAESQASHHLTPPAEPHDAMTSKANGRLQAPVHQREEPALSGETLAPVGVDSPESQFRSPFDRFVAQNLTFPIVMRSFKKLAALAKAALEAMDQNQTAVARDSSENGQDSSELGEETERDSNSLQAPPQSTRPMLTMATSRTANLDTMTTSRGRLTGALTPAAGGKLRSNEHELDGFLVPTQPKVERSKLPGARFSASLATNVMGPADDLSTPMHKDLHHNRTQKSLLLSSPSKGAPNMTGVTVGVSNVQSNDISANASTSQQMPPKSLDTPPGAGQGRWWLPTKLSTNAIGLGVFALISLAVLSSLVIYLSMSSMSKSQNNHLRYIFAPQVAKSARSQSCSSPLDGLISQRQYHKGHVISHLDANLETLQRPIMSQENHYTTRHSPLGLERPPIGACGGSRHENCFKTSEIIDEGHVIIDPSIVDHEHSNESFA